LAEFYGNSKVTNRVITSEVNGKKLRYDAKKLDETLGVPAVSFDVYVCEDKSILGTTRLLELTPKLSQQTGLKTPQSIKKGDMTSIHRFLFWFIIKNFIPRGQGCNLANAMDQCFIDLLDRGNKSTFPQL